MILEQAVLDIKPGQADQFERNFAQASQIIAQIPGYRKHDLLRCLEMPSRYLLLVEWESLADHVEGFRKSPEYQEWKALLHHFYDPFPTVQHFQGI